MATILPDPHLFHLQELRSTTTSIVAVLCSTQEMSACPLCHCPSQRIHSQYHRSLLDLPWQGVAMRLELHVRKWFCATPECLRRVFTERFPSVIMPYARRTARLDTWFTLVGLALGGEAGARLLRGLGLVASPDALLVHLRSLTLPPDTSLQEVGIDEFAFRRGRIFGTIIVDLLTHRVVDLLPDCEATTISQWLQMRPTITVVSRDRATSFGEAIRQGAPQAQQVADRWHLLENLSERLETWLRQSPEALRTAHAAVREHSPALLCKTKAAEVVSQQEHQRQRDCYQRVQRGKEEGLSPTRIARQLGLSRQTVYKYLAMTSPPPRRRIAATPNRVQRQMLAHIQRRWQEGCRNGTQIWRELQAQGCPIAFRTVSRHVALLRKEYGVRGYGSVAPEDERPTMTILTPRKMARLYLKDPAHLTSHERRHLDEVLAKEDRFRAVYAHVQAFGQMVRTRGGHRLEDWLAEVEQGECAPLKSYARGLRKDFAAVFAGLTFPQSQGVVEGHVHRLKLIKRSGYGKMGFPTLRQRVLIRPAS